MDGLLDVTFDVLWASRDIRYGPGLVFRLLLKDATGRSTSLIGEGGRIDQLVGQFTELHCCSDLAEASAEAGADPASTAALLPTSHGISVEIALDKLADAVVSSSAS